MANSNSLLKQEPGSVLGLLLILTAGMVLCSTGCITGERRASHSLDRIAEGMSQDEVRSLLGPADRITLGSAGEIWYYSYGSLPDPRQIAIVSAEIVAVLTIVGACFVMVAYAGHGPGSDPDFSGATSNFQSPQVEMGSVHFRIVFSRAGKVIAVSGIGAGDGDP